MYSALRAAEINTMVKPTFLPSHDSGLNIRAQWNTLTGRVWIGIGGWFDWSLLSKASCRVHIPSPDLRLASYLLLPLAWQMRQRDSHRAISLADEVERDLGEVSLSPSQQSAAIARLQLIRAEVHWLHGEPELA